MKRTILLRKFGLELLPATSLAVAASFNGKSEDVSSSANGAGMPLEELVSSLGDPVGTQSPEANRQCYRLAIKILGACGLSLALIAATGACGKDKDAPSKLTQPTAARHQKLADGLVAPSVFNRIPADTVFVFANYERWEQSLVDAMSGDLIDIVTTGIANLTEDHPKIASFIAENPDFLTLAGLHKIGVSVRPLFALYTHDLSLVFRMELADGKAMRGFLNKTMSSYADPSLEPKTLGSMQYWESPPDDKVMVLAVDDKELVLALMPPATKSELLPYILGDKRPTTSIVDSGELKKVVAKHGGSKGVGYLSLTALVDLLTSGSKVLAGTEFDLSAHSLICQSEIKELAGLAPKAIFGMESMDTDKVSVYLGMDLRSDLAKDVVAAVAPVPGYNYVVDSDAMMAFGMGFNTNKSLSLFEEAAKKVKGSPYQCGVLSGLNEAFSDADEGLDAMPPVFSDIVGYVALFDTFVKESPKSSTGILAIESSDVSALLAFVSNLLPKESKLTLKMGERPVKLDLGPLTSGIDAYAGRGKTMVGVAVGDSKSKLNALLSSKTPSMGPFFLMKLNFASPSSPFADKEDTSEKGLRRQRVLEKLDTWSMEFEATEDGVTSKTSISFR